MMSQSNNVSKKRGFTIMELLVVIAIIGVLSSIVLASLNVARARARDANRVAQMRQVQLALELYYDDFGEYPDAGCLPGPTCGCNSFYIPATNSGPAAALVDGGYLGAVPYDPQHPHVNPGPCYQYQKNYVGVWCGGVDLPETNYVLLFRGETDISNEYTEWLSGNGYRCVSP